MISGRYKDLVNGLRAARGMEPAFPSPAAQPAEIIEADDDGLELNDVDEAAGLMRRVIRDINGEDEDDAADDKDNGESDEFTALGALALPVRKMMVAHYQAKLAEPAPDERRARAVADAAAFIRACASTGVIKR